MHTLRTFVALSVASLAAACANPGTSHMPGPFSGTAPMKMGSQGPMGAMEPRMRAMHEMHLKMKNASTPTERQALMADHLKAMQDGMEMMKERYAMQAGSGAGGMGMGMSGSHGGAASMPGRGDGRGMPADMGMRHQMMADHMEMMQMMMDMMADRLQPAPAGQ